MKYYLVNYLVMEAKQVLENEKVYIPMHTFANVRDFKDTISKATPTYINPASIVIKSYKQVSPEEYNYTANGSLA